MGMGMGSGECMLIPFLEVYLKEIADNVPHVNVGHVVVTKNLFCNFESVVDHW